MKQNLHLSCIPVILLFICSTSLLSQTTIKYSYNNAGHRVARHVITLASADDTTQSASRDKQETFEETVGEQKVIIYPNPTQGELTVEIQGNTENAETNIYLYSLSGTLLTRKNSTGSTTTLDLSAYPAGTYVLKVMLNGKVSEWKIVKK